MPIQEIAIVFQGFGSLVFEMASFKVSRIHEVDLLHHWILDGELNRTGEAI